MKKLRKHVAIAIDGGGLRGVIVTRALAMLESHLGSTCHELSRLVAGTSTGSIIAAGIASGMTAMQMHDLYMQLGPAIFRKTWRSFFWPLTRYRYSNQPLIDALYQQFGDLPMRSFWEAQPKTDVVITTFDLVRNHTCFIKPWKSNYADKPILNAILDSSTIPTVFPVAEGRFVDGGVGSYANPCYLAAYELQFILHWDPADTTLISLGTGRDPHQVEPGQPSRYNALKWLNPTISAFLQSADDQQVHLVETFFTKLDFRRFQVDLEQPLPIDDASAMPKMDEYGTRLGNMILNDQYDRAMGVVAARPNTPVPT